MANGIVFDTRNGTRASKAHWVIGCNHGSDLSDFNALTISRSGSFELDITPEEALPLFTAPGEKLWISIWDPIILHGEGYDKRALRL